MWARHVLRGKALSVPPWRAAATSLACSVVPAQADGHKAWYGELGHAHAATHISLARGNTRGQSLFTPWPPKPRAVYQSHSLFSTAFPSPLALRVPSPGLTERSYGTTEKIRIICQWPLTLHTPHAECLLSSSCYSRTGGAAAPDATSSHAAAAGQATTPRSRMAATPRGRCQGTTGWTQHAAQARSRTATRPHAL